MLRRFWFLFALPVVIVAGSLLPRGGLALRETPGLFPALVGAILLISGFTIDVRRAVRQALNLGALAFSLGSTYVVAPAFAWLLAQVWGPAAGEDGVTAMLFLQAVMIAAAQSSTLATAIALTRLAGGDVELSLMLTLASSALTAFMTPLILHTGIGATVSFPVGDMMARIGLVVVLPVVMGQALRLASRGVLPRPPAFLRPAQQIIILIFVYVGFSAAAGHLRREVLLAGRFLGACVSLHVALLAWTYGLSVLLRFPPGERIALVYSGSQKSVPNGIYVWQTFFPSNPFGAVPLVLHQLAQLVSGFLLVPWFERIASTGDRAGGAGPRELP